MHEMRQCAATIKLKCMIFNAAILSVAFCYGNLQSISFVLAEKYVPKKRKKNDNDLNITNHSELSEIDTFMQLLLFVLLYATIIFCAAFKHAFHRRRHPTHSMIVR